MASSDYGASRLTQVRVWVTEWAASLELPVSVWLLCETAVFRLGVSGVAMTIDNAAGWPETRHSTDALSARLVEFQVTVGEGPCADAGQTGGPVLVTDLDSPAIQRRWPLFAPLAVEAGARALFVLPLCVGTIRLGILALHHIEPRQLEPATLADSLAFAALALRLLLDEQAGLPTTDGGLPLHSPQTHQATGMISAQLNVGMEDAFARLRARAFTDQRPLAELAADVVARRLRFDPTGEAV
ncbi:MAG: GAF and ANTAR domain-containing protein [Pseudonocardiales bacterium]